MIDLMWYMGLPMFAIGVLGVPYKRGSENGTSYNLEHFDTIYDQKQTGTENYKVNVDGVSLIWTSNSLLAAAALLEPALYGEFPDTNIDIVFGEEKPEDLELPVEKPNTNSSSENKPSEILKPENGTSTLKSAPEVLIVEHIQPKPESSQKKSSTTSKRKIHWPQLLRSVLRNKSPEISH